MLCWPQSIEAQEQRDSPSTCLIFSGNCCRTLRGDRVLSVQTATLRLRPYGAGMGLGKRYATRAAFTTNCTV